MPDPKNATGTQAIERAVMLLTTVAERPQLGWRLTDLADYCHLSNATTHRILASLVSLRLVKQRPGDRRYVPGPMLYDLALTLPAHFAFQSACRPHLEFLAGRTNSRVFLALRSGDSYLCLDSAGVSGVRLMSRQGTRRPLVSAAMGNAMLVGLPASVQKEIMASNIRDLQQRDDPYLAGYLRIHRRSRRCGFGYNRSDVFNGVTSLSVPILTEEGHAFASLSAIASTSNFPSDSIRSVVELLRIEAGKIAHDHQQYIQSVS